MTREQLLSLLKDSILGLKKIKPKRNPDGSLKRDEKNEVIFENPEAYRAWKLQTDRVKKEIEGLNSCDQVWLEKEYTKFHKEVIEPEVELLRKKINIPT